MLPLEVVDPLPVPEVVELWPEVLPEEVVDPLPVPEPEPEVVEELPDEVVLPDEPPLVLPLAVLLLLPLPPQATKARAIQMLVSFFIVGNSSKRHGRKVRRGRGLASLPPGSNGVVQMSCRIGQVGLTPPPGRGTMRGIAAFSAVPGGPMGVSKSDNISGLIDELRKEREALDGRLEEMCRRRHLSVDEEVEMKRIKRLKLMKKDRMAEMQASLQRRA